METSKSIVEPWTRCTKCLPNIHPKCTIPRRTPFSAATITITNKVHWVLRTLIITIHLFSVAQLGTRVRTTSQPIKVLGRTNITRALGNSSNTATKIACSNKLSQTQRLLTQTLDQEVELSVASIWVSSKQLPVQAGLSINEAASGTSAPPATTPIGRKTSSNLSVLVSIVFMTSRRTAKATILGSPGDLGVHRGFSKIILETALSSSRLADRSNLIKGTVLALRTRGRAVYQTAKIGFKIWIRRLAKCHLKIWECLRVQARATKFMAI